eukprot:CAMPEP_0118863622 /NCGR_PEP_ID=MMETSP1163-20130328/8425_1 /TAXON_ID=124430 /ORGANISM="Phaeomonas parva, Strain CCMP2877" /LENGTH=145 /DNA_ID=CAMNT_0006797645 /DNA_START=257 /DNA_END=690 /DNA_ORIENTATION=+
MFASLLGERLINLMAPPPPASPEEPAKEGKAPEPPPRGRAAGNEAAASAFVAGERVWYGDELAPAAVVKVHFDESPPYYTVRLDGAEGGRERQTVEEKLRPAVPAGGGAENADPEAPSGAVTTEPTELSGGGDTAALTAAMASMT